MGLQKVTCLLKEVHECPESKIGFTLLETIYVYEEEKCYSLLDNVGLKEGFFF